VRGIFRSIPFKTRQELIGRNPINSEFLLEKNVSSFLTLSFG
jgi:hypothetical protein